MTNWIVDILSAVFLGGSAVVAASIRNEEAHKEFRNTLAASRSDPAKVLNAIAGAEGDDGK